MAFRVQGVEVFSDNGAISKTSITAQRASSENEITLNDQVLVYDGETDDLMKVNIQDIVPNINTFSDDVIVGRLAGSNSTNALNTLIGVEAGFGISGTVQNTAVGYGAGANYTSAGGGGNSFYGALSALNFKGGNFNITAGYQSGLNMDNGTANVLIGYKAGEGLSQGSNNIFIGDNSGNNTSGGTTNLGVATAGNSAYQDRNIIIGHEHQPSFAALGARIDDRMSIGSKSNSWISGRLETTAQGDKPITTLPDTEVTGEFITNVIDITSPASPVSTAIPATETTSYKFDFTDLVGSVNMKSVTMLGVCSKVIVTGLIQADTDTLPTAFSSTIIWNGSQAQSITGTPFFQNLTGADLDVDGSAAGLTFYLDNATGGFWVEIVNPSATPTSGTAFVTIEKFFNPI